MGGRDEIKNGLTKKRLLWHWKRTVKRCRARPSGPGYALWGYAQQARKDWGISLEELDTTEEEVHRHLVNGLRGWLQTAKKHKPRKTYFNLVFLDLEIIKGLVEDRVVTLAELELTKEEYEELRDKVKG